MGDDIVRTLPTVHRAFNSVDVGWRRAMTAIHELDTVRARAVGSQGCMRSPLCVLCETPNTNTKYTCVGNTLIGRCVCVPRV